MGKKVVAAVLAGAAVLLAPVAVHLLQQPAPTHSSVEYMIEEDEQFGAKMSSCSDAATSCLTSKCCKSTGFQCFKSGQTAQCAAKCPSGSCTVLSPSYTSKSAWANGNSLYCYTVFVNEVGTAKSSNPKDLAILKYQKSNGVGIFGCDASSVFSDTTVDFGGASTTAVTPTADWKKYMRKDKPTQYLNTPVFMGVWKQIKAEGYFGNLEVTSKTGMKRFLEQFEAYYAEGGKCWRWDTPACKSAWKYGPWGEDLFMQHTMDDAEVMKKSDFTLTDTGTCPGMRPKADKEDTEFVPSCDAAYKFVAVHPFRNLTAWQTCYDTFSKRQ